MYFKPVILIQVAMHLKSVSAIRIKQEIVDISSRNNETKVVAIIVLLKSKQEMFVKHVCRPPRPPPPFHPSTLRHIIHIYFQLTYV